VERARERARRRRRGRARRARTSSNGCSSGGAHPPGPGAAATVAAKSVSRANGARVGAASRRSTNAHRPALLAPPRATSARASQALLAAGAPLCTASKSAASAPPVAASVIELRATADGMVLRRG